MRSHTMFAHEATNHEGTPYFAHVFGHCAAVKMCGAEEVVEVIVTELPDEPILTDFKGLQYLGFMREGSNCPGMIQPNISMYAVQFPYGYKAPEERGQGKTVRLAITRADSTP